MTLSEKIILAIAIFVAGFMVGIKFEIGVMANNELAAVHARESDAIQQRRLIDNAAAAHAATLATLNKQLGDAREKIANLSGRDCLDPGTVGVLNAVGADAGPAAASNPSGPTTAAAAGTGLRFSTDKDVAGFIAVCRARYAELASQLNQILDIEDKRHPMP